MPLGNGSKPNTNPAEQGWFQSPRQKFKEAGSAMAQISAAAMAVGLEDHRRLLRDAAQRTRDSHAAMMKAAGVEGAPEMPDDEMGDIIVTGDIHVGKHGSGKLPWQGQSGGEGEASEQPQPNGNGNGLSNLAKAAAMTAALMGAGGLGAVAARYFTSPPTPISGSDIDRDWSVTVESGKPPNGE